MSNISSSTIQKMATDYATYLTVNMECELKGVYETVEEMHLRLEEFTSIIGMLQIKEDNFIMENVARFISLKPHINNLCKKIDALDFFIMRVNLDLTTLETNMEIAESTLASSEKKFTTLNPFSMFKKPSESTSLSTKIFYQTPQIFKIEDYFKSNV